MNFDQTYIFVYCDLEFIIDSIYFNNMSVQTGAGTYVFLQKHCSSYITSSSAILANPSLRISYVDVHVEIFSSMSEVASDWKVGYNLHFILRYDHLLTFLLGCMRLGQEMGPSQGAVGVRVKIFFSQKWSCGISN